MKRTFATFLNHLELHCMVVLMGLFIVNITLQVTLRTIFNYPLFFAEEISRTAFLWMVFLGISYATLHDKHIRITFVTAMFPKKVQQVIEIAMNLIAVAAFLWILVTGIEYLQFSAGTKVPALRISKAIYAFILPLSAFLAIVRSIQKSVSIAQEMLGRRESA